MGKVFFTRHGQTIWNVENKICGATDIELTELGHQQAEELGRKLAEEQPGIDEILYSPLVRAAETARHISEMTGIPMRMEPRLKEQNFGRFESTPRNGEEFMEAKSHFLDHYDGGETMMHLCQRVYNLLDDVKAESDHKTYLLVAHNGISRIVQSYFYDMTMKNSRISGLRTARSENITFK